MNDAIVVVARHRKQMPQADWDSAGLRGIFLVRSTLCACVGYYGGNEICALISETHTRAHALPSTSAVARGESTDGQLGKGRGGSGF